MESAEEITTAHTINVVNDNVDNEKPNVDRGSREIADNTLKGKGVTYAEGSRERDNPLGVGLLSSPRSEPLEKIEPSDQAFIDSIADEINRMPRMTIKLFYMFSGPLGRPDGFDAYALLFKAMAEMVDTLADQVRQDVLDDINRTRMESEVDAGEFDAALISCPCSSFTPARDNHGWTEDGPRSLWSS